MFLFFKYKMLIKNKIKIPMPEKLTQLQLEICKFIVSLAPTSYFVLTDKMAEAAYTFILLVLLDTITGMVRSSGWFCGGLISQKMFNFKKFICYVLGILLAFLLDKIPYFNGSFVIFCGWFSIREAWSIMENLADMGLEFPQQIVEKFSGQLRGCKIKKK